MDKFFYRTYQFISRFKWRFVLLLFIALAGLLFTAYHIQFEEDISKLIPVNTENEDYQKVLNTVNFADKIIVNIQRDTTATLDDLTDYASQYLDSLAKFSGTYIKNVQGKVADENVAGTLNFVYDNLPLFLDEVDYTRISEKIERDSIERIVKENYRTLVSPSGMVLKNTILRDPLGLTFIALKKLQQIGIGDDFTLKNGFLVSKDEQHILLFITPEYASNETAKNEPFIEGLYQIQDNLNGIFRNKIHSQLFGSAVIAVANAQQIKKDIQFTVGIALSFLIILLIFFYRNILLPAILLLPTLFGALLAIAFLFLIRENISAISLGIGSVLLGVTLDYSLHILSHIRKHHSVENLYQEISKPILMSSLTTAMAFLCLLFLRSQALQDLGIFAAISVLGASFFALVLIPHLYKGTEGLTEKSTVLDRLSNFAFHKNILIIVFLGALMVTGFFTFNTVQFNKDIAELNYESAEIIHARENLESLTNIGSKSIYIAVYGSTTEQVLQINDSLRKSLSGFKEQGKILDYSSLGSLVQSTETQREKIELWNTFWDDEKQLRIEENLVESGTPLGFKPTTFDAFFIHLKDNFQPLHLQDFASLKAISVEDYLIEKDGFYTIATLIKANPDQIQGIRKAFANRSQTVLIDRQQINEKFLGKLKSNFNRLIGYSIIVILLLLFLYYKSFTLTMVTSLPIFLTWFLTLGLMGLLHLEFNIFNIIISTFIFGLGIDYSIFMTNGLLLEYRTGEPSLGTHKTSIILSVLTTILGMGVLVFAKHPALYSISLVSLIGILSAMLIAFTVQPLLFKLFIGSVSKRPISLRLLLHSLFSFGYYGLMGLLLSVASVTIIPLLPISKKRKMGWFHKGISKMMKSVLYTNGFVKKQVINEHKETFEKPAVIIANHTSALDVMAMGMLSPKIVFLVTDHVYNSPILGKAVKAAGYYPVSHGLEKGVTHLQRKLQQGYSLMAFPEGTRSETNKIRRFHKGAFYLAENYNLDILPVLIHGNSEVLSKNTFIIRNGAITLKILDRISPDNPAFGSDYRTRTKKIGAYFKKQFEEFREERESPTYFHMLVLEDFRFKGRTQFSTIRKDLKRYQKTYHQILKTIGKKEKIVHISEDHGQLDFLLALDGPDRSISSFLMDSTSRKIFKNSFITNKYPKLRPLNTMAEALTQSANILILNVKLSDLQGYKNHINEEISTLLLLKKDKDLAIDDPFLEKFSPRMEYEDFIVLKKQHLDDEGAL